MQRSFYYWETIFSLSSKEQGILQQQSVHQLYVKFLTWNGPALPYTKPSPAKKLLEMEAKIKTGAGVPDKARLYYQYASAL